MDSASNSLFDSIERHSSKLAIVQGDTGSWSYAKLLERADDRARDVAPRSFGFLLVDNTAESLAAYLGIMRRKAVPLLLSASVDGDLLKKLQGLYQPDWIMKGSSWILRPGASAGEVHSDLALCLATSGSTGSPKVVRLSQKNIEANTASIVEYLKVSQADRAITTLPMNYSFGLSIVHTHLSQGAGLIMTSSSLFQTDFWSLVRNVQATTFGGVPVTYEQLRKLRFADMELPSLRYLTQAGGHLKQETLDYFLNWAQSSDRQFIVMYGQTEATARISYVPHRDSVSKRGSIGIAVPGGRLSLIDESGAAIKLPNTSGELVYEGRNVALGYAQSRADLSRGDDWQGKLRTGDFAAFDSDGYFYVKGRRLDFAKVFGHRVNTRDIESWIGGLGLECACVGGDEKIKVFATDMRQKGQATALLTQRTGLHPSAFEWVQVPEIPRSDSGKILYGQLVEVK